MNFSFGITNLHVFQYVVSFSLPPGLERGWKVADTDPLLTAMPVIMETSGISVNSLDAALFASLDDAEEAREQHDEELEALEAAMASYGEPFSEPTPGSFELNDAGQPSAHRFILTSRTSTVPEGGDPCSGETIESYEANE